MVELTLFHRQWQPQLLLRVALVIFVNLENRQVRKMNPYEKHDSIAALMDRSNVDTDQIIPKQFLKKVERSGFGVHLFHDWRYNPDGSDNPDFELNNPAFKGARVLVALVAAAPAVALARTVGRRAPILVLCPGVAVALLVGYGLIGPPVEHRWYHVPTFQLGLLFGLAAWSHLWARSPGWTRGWPQRAMLVLIALTLWALPGAIDRRGDAYLETQGRIRAYDQFIDWIVSNGLTDTSILTREPGYITYHTGQRAIDAAGLVTEGIYFHGPEQRRTDLLALVEQHRPDFLVRPRMPTPELLRHYVPVVEVPRVRILLMRRDLHRLHSSGPGLIFEDGFEGGDTGYWTTPGR